MTFSLRLLGGTSIEGPDGALTGRATQRHRLALLAMLAASTRGGITRDKLIAYLWPESDDERARRSLSDSIYRINKALGDEAVLAVGDELRLDQTRLTSDVAAFAEALERRDWERAVEAYTGPFLDGFHLSNAPEFERWLDGERDALARRYGAALESLAEGKAAAGDPKAAVTVWRRRAALDRYDSRIAIRLMEALDAAGNRAGALQHARIHAQLLEDEFGTGPDAEVLALVERLRAPVREERSRTVPTSGDAAEASEAEAEPVEPAEGRISPPPGVTFPLPRTGRGRRHRLSLPAMLLGIAVLAAVGIGLLRASRSDPTPAGPPGIAVLPFENPSPDEESLFFADGVTEDVLTNLSRVADFRVIARASVMQYRDSGKPIPEIARELGVQYVLRGSVRRSHDDVRITAQLIDARTNANVWAQTYDRRLEDIFAVQSDIARRVVDALEGELTTGVAAGIDRAPTEDLVAYNLYLRGRYFWHRRTEDGLLQSAGFFESAVERDSGFARAWAGLADAYSVLAFYDYLPPGEAYPKAKQAATRALAIDETLAEAHASLGYITLYFDWNADRAEAEFRRAIELNPSYSVAHQWYANLLVATGRFEEADREMSRAREVNPLSQIANLALGWVYYHAGRYEDAVRQYDMALEMDPEWDLAFLFRGLALEELGRADEAIASLQHAVELSGGSGITLAALAHAHAGAGERERARELLTRLIDATEVGRYQPSFEIAKVHVALGHTEEAIRWLERAFDEHSHSMVFLEVDPQLASMRDDPDFRRIVERVALVEPEALEPANDNVGDGRPHEVLVVASSPRARAGASPRS
jgi:TolB-like protein/DNA-binding SARP family transcriptional activator